VIRHCSPPSGRIVRAAEPYGTGLLAAPQASPSGVIGAGPLSWPAPWSGTRNGRSRALDCPWRPLAPLQMAHPGLP